MHVPGMETNDQQLLAYGVILSPIFPASLDIWHLQKRRSRSPVDYKKNSKKTNLSLLYIDYRMVQCES